MIADREVLRSLRPGLELAKDAIVVTSAGKEPQDTRVVFVNDAFVKLAGHAASEFVGRSVGVLYDHQAGGAILRKLFKDLLNCLRRAKDFSLADGNQGGTASKWQAIPLLDEEGTLRQWRNQRPP